MRVSCLCPTYNRPPNSLHLLSEAVESFRRQRLPRGVGAELVILNDTPGQRLVCGESGVRVVNAPRRYDTLGEKRNALALLARGDVFFVWDDDDISLPGRIEQALRFLQKGTAYFNPQRSWWLDRGLLHKDHNHGYCHNASAFTRRAWETVGGYPHTSGNEDALMDERLRAAFGVNAPIEDHAEWQYLYRWGVSPRHLSGIADGPPGDPHREHYRRIGEKPVIPGDYQMIPGWRQDYVEMCRKACV